MNRQKKQSDFCLQLLNASRPGLRRSHGGCRDRGWRKHGRCRCSYPGPKASFSTQPSIQRCDVAADLLHSRKQTLEVPVPCSQLALATAANPVVESERRRRPPPVRPDVSLLADRLRRAVVLNKSRRKLRHRWPRRLPLRPRTRRVAFFSIKEIPSQSQAHNAHFFAKPCASRTGGGALTTSGA